MGSEEGSRDMGGDEGRKVREYMDEEDGRSE